MLCRPISMNNFLGTIHTILRKKIVRSLTRNNPSTSYKTVLVLFSLYPSLIHPFHLLPSHGINYRIFLPSLLRPTAYFYLVSSNNIVTFGKYVTICVANVYKQILRRYLRSYLQTHPWNGCRLFSCACSPNN